MQLLERRGCAWNADVMVGAFFATVKPKEEERMLRVDSRTKLVFLVAF